MVDTLATDKTGRRSLPLRLAYSALLDPRTWPNYEAGAILSASIKCYRSPLAFRNI